jgi:curved DNA-binding protein CbpA
MSASEKAASTFKDYYLILQIHPEADYAMVDAAYWHLARRYNQAALADPSARARLDALNEAYSVLGSPVRRDEYNRVRARALGDGALPVPERAAAQPPPLAVMERQRPRPRQAQPAKPADRTWAVLSLWQVIGVAIAMLALGVAAIGTWATPEVVAGVLGAGIALLVLPVLVRRLSLPRIRVWPRSRGRPTAAPAHLDTPPDGAAISPEELRAQVAMFRQHARDATDHEPAAAPHAPPSA